MGTGYNTEVSFSGVRYHVQTEDKGSPRCEIVSHIYQGGAILLTKRVSYRERPADQPEAVWVQEMTTKQHMDILKVIQQGGVDLLRVYMAKENQSSPARPVHSNPVPMASGHPSAPPVRPAPSVKVPGALRITPPSHAHTAQGTEDPLTKSSSPDHPPVVTAAGPLGSLPVRPAVDALPSPEAVGLRLLNSPDFRAGRPAGLKVAVFLPPDTPLPNVKVIVQIFGVSFRPILFSGRTDASGLFILDVTLPTFSAGQASLNILAVSEKFGMAELKYAIKRA